MKKSCRKIKYNEEETKYVDGVGSPPLQEVKAKNHLLFRLLLCRSKSDQGDATDSLMCKIAQGRGTRPDKNTNRLDKNFVQAFINMLNLNLTLNDFTQHSVLPKEMDGEVKKQCMELLTHNHKILDHYLRSISPSLFDRFAKNTNGNISFDVGRPISKIFNTRRDIFNKLNTGVCTCWSKYEGKINPRKKPMWIHHAFLLQFILPKVNEHLYQGYKTYKNDNGDWNKFMKNLNDTSTEKCKNLVAWNGCKVLDKEFNKEVGE
jgi:hypothetical protein